MKKVLSYLLVISFLFTGFINNVGAITVSKDDVDLDENYIKLPDSLVLDEENVVGLKGLEGALAYYQVINVSNDTNLYEKYKAALVSSDDSSAINDFFEALNGTSGAVYDDNNWSDIIDGKFTPALSGVQAGDKLLLWVKYASQTKTVYSLSIYEIGEANNPASDTTENPDTGINDWYWYLIPVALIVGSALVIKKNRYE